MREQANRLRQGAVSARLDNFRGNIQAYGLRKGAVSSGVRFVKYSKTPVRG